MKLAPAFALLSASCGTPEAPAITLELTRKELAAETAQVAIYFYTTPTTCEDVRATLPHPPSVLGPFVAAVDPAARDQGITFNLDAIPADTYVVFVDALDASGTIVGSGCAPGQQVHEHEISRIRVKIS